MVSLACLSGTCTSSVMLMISPVAVIALMYRLPSSVFKSGAVAPFVLGIRDDRVSNLRQIQYFGVSCHEFGV